MNHAIKNHFAEKLKDFGRAGINDPGGQSAAGAVGRRRVLRARALAGLIDGPPI